MDIHHQAQQLGQKAVCAWHEGKHELARDLLRSAISIHGTVYYPGPGIGRYAWQRAAYGHGA